MCFFKQKTAYEMRISDWSSDVCSSDLLPDFRIEAQFSGPVCGIDEAGRGPWAGPVVAAAAILDPARLPPGIDDSKKLTAARREALFAAVLASASIGIGAASVAEIERLNILGATLLAMRRAVAALPEIGRAHV